MTGSSDRRFDAVLLDLDGVVTRTAEVHARAWKRTFDAFLEERARRGRVPFEPFDIGRDYPRYVDGKTRYDGVRSFLASRGLNLPEGNNDEEPDQETVGGLGSLKDRLFLELLAAEGVGVFEDAAEQIIKWRAEGVKIAIVSSSRNCSQVLKAAGLVELFDVQVDGLSGDRLRLRGKPAPDSFLEAARQLGVDPARAVVIEDATSGVEAGRAGGFGLVVGVDRSDRGEALMEMGADLVVRSLGDVRLDDGVGAGGRRDPSRLPQALTDEGLKALLLAASRLAVFLDYDGTLTPIVSRPELATLSKAMRSALKDLASRCTVAIVSGRDRKDVEGLVRLQGLVYAGSHGFDIAGPRGLSLEHEGARGCLLDLDAAEERLRDGVGGIPGILLERKRFGLAVHYRNVAEGEVPGIDAAVSEVVAAHERLLRKGGKKVFEIRPRIDWDKGKAVRWLLRALQLDDPDILPIFIGDDLTDEDAFRELGDQGVGILVERPEYRTFARYALGDPKEVRRFLLELVDILGN